MDAVLSTLNIAGTVIFWIVLILIPLVIVHEFGHSIMAWLTKVRVVEFGVGLPPRTKLNFRKKGLLWSFNWLPVGGFAKIYGDHDALDTAVNDPLPTKEQTKERYAKDRLIEVVDADLEALLKNNGLTLDSDWIQWEQYMQRNSKLLKSYLATGLVPEECEDSRARQWTQVNKLIQWELEGITGHKSAFYSRNVFVKTLILIGGVLFNYLFAIVLITGLLLVGSIERLYISPDEVYNNKNLQTASVKVLNTARVAKDMPLARAGVVDQAVIVSFGGEKFENFASFGQIIAKIQSSEGTAIEVVYKEKKDSTATKSVLVTPVRADANSSYKIGVSFVTSAQYRAKDGWSVLPAAIDETNYLVDATVKGLGRVFGGLGNSIVGKQTQEDRQALDEVGGPIRIGGYGARLYEILGVGGVVYATAAFSVGLAVANLLPLPVLDGGRILLIWIGAITKKRNKKLEGVLIGSTMILMLGLFVLMAFRDSGFVSQLLSR